MSVLSIVQDAAIQIAGREPVTVYTSTELIEKELRTLLKVVTDDLIKAAEWPVLTFRGSVTGNGAAESFDLPSDFDRMPVKGNIYSTRSTLPLAPVHDLDRWLEFEITPVVGYPGYWIMLQGKLNIRPALANAEQAKFYYISNLAWRDSAGTGKRYPTTDNDSCKLNERLVSLALIWRWRAMKKLDYAEEMRSYEIALAQDAGSAKGPRMITVGAVRFPADVHYAYPGQIVP